MKKLRRRLKKNTREFFYNMLYLIGIGFDEKDLSIKSLEILRKCNYIFIERYTSIATFNLEELKKIIGKEILEVSRKDLEENSNRIIELAEKNDVAILVIGDPLVATTHIALCLEAIKRGVKYKIIHAASIINCILNTGISIYKIGKILTIPLKEKFSKPLKSIYDWIKYNKEKNLHTILLLDVDIESNKYLTVKEALEYLLEMEKEFSENVINEEDFIVVISRGCMEDERIIFGKIKEIIHLDIKLPATLIYLSEKLSSIEIEFLSQFKI